MVSQVTLGNFIKLPDGKTILGGVGGSGLDTQSLIDSLVKARSIAATQYQDQIDIHSKQSEALGKFQQLLSSFQSASDALRNPPGVSNDANNAFKFRTATVSTAGSAFFSVSASPGATIQSFAIRDVESLASAGQQTTGIFTVADADASVVPPAAGAVAFAAGIITINSGPGGPTNIEIEANDSLNDIAAKFNLFKDSTGIAASVIKVSDGNFILSFNATETGLANSFDLATATDPSGVFTNVSLSAATAGTNAKFKLNNIQIERDTNTVTDVINGVTINLMDTTSNPLTSYTTSITADTSIVQNSIVNFINSYNALKTFFAEQTQLGSDGAYTDKAVLANNQAFRSIMSTVSSQVLASVDGIVSGPKSLTDLGITFTTQPATADLPQVDNVLTVDDGKLAEALASNFDGVTKLFGFNLTSDNPDLVLFKSSNNLSVSNFSLNIDETTNTFQATYDPGTGPVTVNMTATKLAGGVDGYTLTGPAGSALEGIQLIYASATPATINVTVTQGIADRLYNTTQTALDSTDGMLTIETESLKASDKRLQSNIDLVNLQVAQYRETLIRQFAALEQAISKVNSLLNSLNANDSARLASSGFGG